MSSASFSAAQQQHTPRGAPSNNATCPARSPSLWAPLPHGFLALYACPPPPGMSKLMVCLYTAQLAERLRDKGIMVNALCPGWVSVRVVRVGAGGEGKGERQIWMPMPPAGAWGQDRVGGHRVGTWPTLVGPVYGKLLKQRKPRAWVSRCGSSQEAY